MKNENYASLTWTCCGSGSDFGVAGCGTDHDCGRGIGRIALGYGRDSCHGCNPSLTSSVPDAPLLFSVTTHEGICNYYK